MDFHLACLCDFYLLRLSIPDKPTYHSEYMLDIKILLGRALDILPLIAFEQILGDLILAHSLIGGSKVHLVADQYDGCV